MGTSRDLSTLELPSIDDERIRRASEPGTTMGEIVRLFPDPGEAFVVCPNAIDIRQLARLYAPTKEHIPDMISELRRRSSDERWRERRAIFQAKRVEARRDAIIETEATVWAIMAMDFHSSRIRSMMDRRDMLDAMCMEQLESCVRGDRGMDNGLRDALRELRAIEDALVELMPDLNAAGKAQDTWSSNQDSREGLVKQIGERLNSIAGGEDSKSLFELIEGGRAQEEG